MGIKIIATNKKAYHDYFIDETFEIDKLIRLTEQKGLAMVPIKIYFKRNYVKLEIGIGRGKKLYDKRETLKRKDADREMAKAIKNAQR